MANSWNFRISGDIESSPSDHWRIFREGRDKCRGSLWNISPLQNGVNRSSNSPLTILFGIRKGSFGGTATKETTFFFVCQNWSLSRVARQIPLSRRKRRWTMVFFVFFWRLARILTHFQTWKLLAEMFTGMHIVYLMFTFKVDIFFPQNVLNIRPILHS